MEKFYTYSWNGQKSVQRFTKEEVLKHIQNQVDKGWNELDEYQVWYFPPPPPPPPVCLGTPTAKTVLSVEDVV